jgi:hypothetical protein
MNRRVLTLYTDGAVEIPTNSSGVGTLQSTGPVWISGNGIFWKFGTDGVLAIPTSNTGSASITAASNITLTANTSILSLNSGGAVDFPLVGGTTALLRTTGNLTLNANGKEWLYGTNGTITFPDSTVQSTAYYSQVTNRYYVDPARSDSYVMDGSRAKPYTTIGAAITAINARITAGYNTSTNPIYIMLQGSTTENITLTKGRVYIVGEGGGIHAPIYITASTSAPTITVNPTSGDLNTNRFSLMGVQVVGALGQNAVYVTGTSPVRMFMQDVWITANASGGVGFGYVQDNTGTGTVANADSLKLSQNGTGDVYCINIVKGSATFNAVETSGATQVAAVQTGASLTLNASELDANGDIVCETYGTGTLTITGSVITNAQANSSGIQANGAGTLLIGNCIFSIPTGTGSAIKNASGVSFPSAGYPTLAYGGVVFTTGYNTTVDLTFLLVPQSTATGTIVNSTLVSPTVNTSILAGTTTVALLNTTATTLNIGGAATTLTVGNTATAAQTVSMFTASTGASTYNLATGATTNGTTKAINIGSSGVSGSITNISLGSSVSGATGTVTINGTAINVATNSSSAVTTTFGPQVTANILKIAGTSAGTVSLTSDVTTGTVNIFTGTTTGAINIGSSSSAVTAYPAAGTTASAASGIGYMGMPQNSKATTYSTVIGDAGKHIYVTATATMTIDGSVAYPIGTTIAFIAASGATATIAIGTDAMYFASTGTTGSRTLAPFGMATAVKVASGIWFINGTGLT